MQVFAEKVETVLGPEAVGLLESLCQSVNRILGSWRVSLLDCCQLAVTSSYICL